MKSCKSIFLMLMCIVTSLSAQNKPLKIVIAGLTHTHVHWIFSSEQTNSEFEIVGIVEPNIALAERYNKQYKFGINLVYTSLEEAIAKTEPEAVTAFGTIYDHLEIVEICAPKGIHVMVEKPLAVNMKHAKKMAELAKKTSNSIAY